MKKPLDEHDQLVIENLHLKVANLELQAQLCRGALGEKIAELAVKYAATPDQLNLHTLTWDVDE